MQRLGPLAHPDLVGPLLMWAGIPALIFVFGQGRFVYAAVGLTLFVTAAAFSDKFSPIELGPAPGLRREHRSRRRGQLRATALMAGAISEAVLVIRESIHALPFRSGWRETPVARMPRDPARLVRRARLRLFAVAVAAGVHLMVGALALGAH